MWGPISQLDDYGGGVSYEARRVRAFPEKFQRPLSEREKMLIQKVKDGVYDERSGRVVLNEKVLDDYKCPRRERMIVMDEVEGKRGRQRRCPRYGIPYDPEEAERAKKAPPRPTYLELLRDHFIRP